MRRLGGPRQLGVGSFRGIGGVAIAAAGAAPGAPTISGTVTIGGTLNIVAGTGTTTSYALYRDGVSAGAVVSGYTYLAADIGPSLTVRALGPGGTSAASNAVAYDPVAVTAVFEVFSIRALAPGAVTTMTGLKAGIAMTQAVAGSRPTASQTSFNSRPGLTFDGGDLLGSGAGGADFSSMQAVRVVMAMVDTTGDTTTTLIMELGPSFSVIDGSFAIATFVDGASAGTVNVCARGVTGFGNTRSPETLASACVMAFCADTANANGTGFVRKNGSALSPTSITSTCAAGPLVAGASAGLNLGGRFGGSFFWTGVIGGEILILSGNAVDADLADAEAYVAYGAGL